MTTKIVATTTEGLSREDGNVYHAGFLLVSSDHLAFDEPVFSLDVVRTRDLPDLASAEDERHVDHQKLIAHLRELGYTVLEPEVAILTTAYDEEGLA